jgi:phosphoserine phosphatase
MKIALFIDIDGVITIEPINLQIARLLDVEDEVLKIEEEFRTGKMTNEAFNKRLIPLFRKKNFTKAFMEEHFDEMQKRILTEQLLKLPVEIYFVSSGPSYYLLKLAEDFGISESNILCTRYSFDENGLLKTCEDPSDSMDKSDFVKLHAKEYDIAIGLGDTVENDAPFLSHCNIRILMGEEFRRGYLCATGLTPVINLVRNISLEASNPLYLSYSLHSNKCKDGVLKLLSESSYEKNVFIMTPYLEDPNFTKMLQVIKKILAEAGFKGWIAHDKQLDSELWGNVQSYLLGCKYGIAIFTHEEDVMVSTKPYFNPNVSIELGYMLGRGKQILLLKDKELDSLQTDLFGSLYHEYDLNDYKTSIRKEIENWLNDID